MFESLHQDVRGALHGLRRSPGFAAAALVTLALGIGATSAIFSVVKAVLLTPLPYEAPEQRVMVWSKWVNFDKTWVSSQDVIDYRELATTMTVKGSAPAADFQRIFETMLATSPNVHNLSRPVTLHPKLVVA